MKKTNNAYELKEATLYSAFRRLEQAGCIRTYWGDETVGARRRYYAITDDGRKAYHGYKQEWQEAKEIIDKLLKQQKKSQEMYQNQRFSMEDYDERKNQTAL